MTKEYFRRALFLATVEALLVVGVLVGPVKAQPAIQLIRNWWHAPVGMSLAVDTTLLDFGRVTVGDSQDLVLTISNTGEQDLQVRIEMLAPPFSFDLNPTPFVIPAGASQTCTVIFSPASAGKVFGALSILSSRGNVQVALRGKAVPLPLGRR
jgi:hypothetical protein